MTPKLPDLNATLVRHPTAGDILQAHWLPALAANGIPASAWLEGEMRGVDERGRRTKPIPMREALADLRRMPLWGWCDIRQRIVHVWVSRRAKPEQVLHLLAHELAHVAKRIKPTIPKTCQPANARAIREEFRCELAAAICVQAVAWAKQLTLPSRKVPA